MDLSAVRDEITCPVCLEIPRAGGFFQCPNGHLICEADFDKLRGAAKICPKCRSPFVNAEAAKKDAGKAKPARSALADSLLDAIELPCRNKDLGCDKVMKRKLLLKHEKECPLDKSPCKYEEHGCKIKVSLSFRCAHERSCRFEPVPCVVLGGEEERCNARLPCGLMSAHVRSCHKAVRVVDSWESRQAFPVDEGSKDESRGVTHWPGCLMKFDGKEFFAGLCRMDRSGGGGEWRAWVYMIGNAKEAEEYRTSICMWNPKRRQRSVRHQGPVNASHCFGADRLTTEVTGLVVPGAAAKRDLVNAHAQWRKKVVSLTFQVQKVQQEKDK